MGTDKEKVRAYLQPFIGLRDPKGELVRKAYFEIFKEELETEAVILTLFNRSSFSMIYRTYKAFVLKRGRGVCLYCRHFLCFK